MTELSEMIKPITDLLKIYRRTPYYLPLLKFCLYELATSFYFFTKRGRRGGAYNPFTFSTPDCVNPDVSSEFLARIKFHIKNLAEKIGENNFNYCCSNFIFEPLTPARIKGLGDCVADRIKKNLGDSLLDDLKDIIIGAMYNLE